MRKWSLHVCVPWNPDCQTARLNIRTPWAFLMIGTPSQVWNPWTGRYIQKWFWITAKPIGATETGGPKRRQLSGEAGNRPPPPPE